MSGNIMELLDQVYAWTREAHEHMNDVQWWETTYGLVATHPRPAWLDRPQIDPKHALALHLSDTAAKLRGVTDDVLRVQIRTAAAAGSSITVHGEPDTHVVVQHVAASADGVVTTFHQAHRAYRATYRCSFCGKSQEQVKHLTAGPGGVYICNECVALCMQLNAEMDREDQQPQQEQMQKPE